MASRLKWLALFSTVVATAAAAACNGSGRPDAADIALSGSSSGGANAAQGTACTSVGATQSCGSVEKVVDNNVVCSVGYQLCGADGTWGACTAERVITKSLSGLDIQGLGDAGSCADPCTVGCSTTVDTPTGITLPTGLNANDGGGLTITASTPPPNTCVGIAIAPLNPTITVTSSATLTTKQFTSTLLPVGCNPSAPSPLWYTDKFDVAQMSTTSPGLMTVAVPIAGPVNVSAALGNFTATTTANVVVAIAENSSTNAPPPLATILNFVAELATDPIDTNLEVLYPYQDTVFPMGLTAPLIQWRNNGVAATGGVEVTLQYPPLLPFFQITELATETMTAPVPLRTAQPRYAVPQNQWFALEQTVNRNRATFGDTARILIRRRVGSTTYLSKYVDVHFAPGQLKGRVYYNSYGTALASNYSGAKNSTGGAFTGGAFGAATLAIVPGGTAPIVAAGDNGSGGGCTVCHTASANGSTLISAQNGSPYITKEWTLPGTAANAGVATVQTGTQLVFAGINPTSTRILSSAGAFSGDSTSRLFDGVGNLISGANVPTGLKAGYPAFSPDGTKVAFTFRGGSASPLASLTGDGSTLSMMTFDGNKTFSAFRNLTTPLLGPTVWPSFLPANDGIVYQIETRTTPDGGYSFTRHDCECGATYTGATGELWWVSTGTIPMATRLSRLNGYDVLGNGALPATPTTGHSNYLGTAGPGGTGFYEQRYNYEPTVLPQQIGGYSWVIFTSRRAYGNVATINPYASDPRYDDISIDPTPKKLWIAALDGTATPGLDPSHPAFYLPGQELIAGNSRGVFALDSCHPAVSGTPTAANLCDSDLDCCNAPGTAACVLDPPPLASPPVKHCVAAAANVCRNVGESCLTTSNCCNAASGGVCAAGVCATPPSYYTPQTYTRDYTQSCAPGYTVRWGLFDWQSKTPGDSSIVFSAQVSSDGVTFTPATPTTFATASGADVVSPSWATSGTYVSDALGEPKGGSSTDKTLRITMLLKPTTDKGSSPTLIDWRQSIICVPSE